MRRVRGVEAHNLLALAMFLYGEALPPLALPRVADRLEGEVNIELILEVLMRGYVGSVKEQLASASATSLPLMRNALAVGQGVAGLVLEPYRDKHKLRGARRGGMRCAHAVFHNSLDVTAAFLSSVTSALEKAETLLSGEPPPPLPQTGDVGTSGVPSPSFSQALRCGASSAIQGLKTAYKTVGEEAGEWYRPARTHPHPHASSLRNFTIALVAPTRGFLGALQATLVGARNAVKRRGTS
mmetsp:Transcript_62885/g.130726  ORF Transcript_62885/g.130726 Transcript_62885/m.130726 type:complete len:240 (-) Transcript_62885:7-726(-)